MSLPLTTKKSIEFTPPYYEGADGAPVYKLKVPNYITRAEFRAKVAESGVVYVTDADYMAALREGYISLSGENASPVMLELLDQRAAGVELTEAEAKIIQDLAVTVREQYYPFAALVARQIKMHEILPALACQLFIEGWRNLDVKFEREREGLPAELLDQLPQSDIMSVGAKIMASMNVNREQAKN